MTNHLICKSLREYAANIAMDVLLYHLYLSPPGVTKRCRLSWLTNSDLVYEPKCGGRGEGLRGLSNEYSCAHGDQINFGDYIFYLTNDRHIRRGGGLILINHEYIPHHSETAVCMVVYLGSMDVVAMRIPIG
jgi:hypothetical protein